jgi:hypothetical protein
MAMTDPRVTALDPRRWRPPLSVGVATALLVALTLILPTSVAADGRKDRPRTPAASMTTTAAQSEKSSAEERRGPSDKSDKSDKSDEDKKKAGDKDDQTKSKPVGVATKAAAGGTINPRPKTDVVAVSAPPSVPSPAPPPAASGHSAPSARHADAPSGPTDTAAATEDHSVSPAQIEDVQAATVFGTASDSESDGIAVEGVESSESDVDTAGTVELSAASDEQQALASSTVVAVDRANRRPMSVDTALDESPIAGSLGIESGEPDAELADPMVASEPVDADSSESTVVPATVEADPSQSTASALTVDADSSQATAADADANQSSTSAPTVDADSSHASTADADPSQSSTSAPTVDADSSQATAAGAEPSQSASGATTVGADSSQAGSVPVASAPDVPARATNSNFVGPGPAAQSPAQIDPPDPLHLLVNVMDAPTPASNVVSGWDAFRLPAEVLVAFIAVAGVLSALAFAGARHVPAIRGGIQLRWLPSLWRHRAVAITSVGASCAIVLLLASSIARLGLGAQASTAAAPANLPVAASTHTMTCGAIDLTVSLDPPQPRVGQLVTLHMHVINRSTRTLNAVHIDSAGPWDSYLSVPALWAATPVSRVGGWTVASGRPILAGSDQDIALVFIPQQSGQQEFTFAPREIGVIWPGIATRDSQRAGCPTA